MPVAFVSKAHAAGLTDTSLDSQNVTVTGNVYDYAVANTLPTLIDLGNIHAGKNFTAQSVSVQNLAAASAYSESLQATSGNWDVVIAPGESASLMLGISDNTGGHKTVSVPVAFTSKAVAGSNLDDTVGAGSGIAGLQTQNVIVTGNVYDYAAPNAIASPGSVGKVYKNTPVSRLLTVANLAPESYSEGLNASFGEPSGGIQRHWVGVEPEGPRQREHGDRARYVLGRRKERFRDRQPRIERYEQRSGGHRPRLAIGLDERRCV